ncbi:hypothetical protein [Flexistipes sp.]|uniref:hypothetical protein n=1 Tax=Flexistipes sp. TaxID=3088135 RepID=UPI002E22830F|nr:hypothetical protein [Flexistipes sp.]
MAAKYIDNLASLSGVAKADVKKVFEALAQDTHSLNVLAENIKGYIIFPNNPPVKKMISEAKRTDSLLNSIVRLRLRGKLDAKIFNNSIDKYAELVTKVTEYNNELKQELYGSGGNKKENPASKEKKSKTNKKVSESKTKKGAVVGDPLST